MVNMSNMPQFGDGEDKWNKNITLPTGFYIKFIITVLFKGLLFFLTDSEMLTQQLPHKHLVEPTV